ncbi:hypothetical protein IGJ48_003167 [Enterococcus pernyi]
MLETLISALLPIIVTMVLGYYSGHHGDFTSEDSKRLTKLIMTYSLPMSLFGGILSSKKSQFIQNGPVVLWMLIGLVVVFFLVYFIARLLFKQSSIEAVILALLIGCPSIPFVGPSVLGALFPTNSAILISIGALIINIVLVPASAVLLSLGESSEGHPNSLGFKIAGALKKPVVWAPILALVLLLCGVHLDLAWGNTFKVLGKATGGLALFAAGIILQSEKPSFSLHVWLSSLIKVVVIPCVLWILMSISGISGSMINMVLISFALPTAVISTIFANQYDCKARETSSTLFLTTILSLVFIAVLIIVRGL